VDVSPDDRVGKAAFGLHAQLVMLAARASKPALDLILGSNYIEAFALERSMLESWSRGVFVRLKKGDYHRWYQPYTETRGDTLPRREPQWSEVRQWVSQKGGPDDQALIERAQLHWDFLNLGAHPSGHAVDRTYNTDHLVLMFYPESDWESRVHALAHGTFVQSLVLREVELMGPHAEGWIIDVAAFRQAAETIWHAVQPDLNLLANALAAERELRKKLNKDRCGPLTPA
jgi:hypothetical protein